MRNSLIPDNQSEKLPGRFGRYFFYAIGEIVLVVIGILLALQVNNWNLQRKNKIEEKRILSSLNLEFRENKKLIISHRAHFDGLENAHFKLMALMNKSRQELLKNNLDSIIYKSIEHTPFNPTNAVFSEILQGGKLSLLTDAELKNDLFKWTRELAKNETTYSLFEKWTEEQILVFYVKNIALKNVDKYSPMGWKQDSGFESGTVEIFGNREFENIIDNELYHIGVLKQEYQLIEEIIDAIVQKTE